MMQFGVMTDYDYSTTHKRERITVWEGSFMSSYTGEGYSLPKGDGYMLTTYNDEKVRVSCPTPRTEETYREIDAAIDAALVEHFTKTGRAAAITNGESK